MALAALCSRAQKSSDESYLLKPFRTLEFQAFVVDHGVRSGSDVEAASVSKVLEKRGIFQSDLGPIRLLIQLQAFKLKS
jgi:tRNA(Ile)-lysidine synthase